MTAIRYAYMADDLTRVIDDLGLSDDDTHPDLETQVSHDPAERSKVSRP